MAVTPEHMPGLASREDARASSDWQSIELKAGHQALMTSTKASAKLLLAIGQ